MATRSVNKVILLGRLGKDAETKFSPSGMSVSKFTLATNRRTKDAQSGDWKEETDWHNIVLFKAENYAQYLTKGKQVYIEGKLTSRSYDDKDGNKRYITEVIADDVVLLGGRGEDGGGGTDRDEYSAPPSGPVSMPRSAQPRQGGRPAPARDPDYDQGGVGDDDVPF